MRIRPEMHRQQGENGQGGEEGLGGSDANFRPGMHVNAAVGFARDGAANDVDDGQGAVAAAFGFAQRAQGVGRFAGLGQDQQHGVALQRGVAGGKFVAEFDFHGQVGQFLDQVFPGQGRVPTGAGGADDQAFNGAQFRHRHVQAAEARGGPFKIDASPQGVFHRARLLEDFLEHEMGILAALGFFGGEFQAADLHLGGVGAQALHVETLARHGGHVVVVEINDLAGVGDDGVGVAGQKILLVADADDEGRTAPSANDGRGARCSGRQCRRCR